MADLKPSVKTVLLSQFPLPYSKIGSWTTLYKNYLSGNHQIDFIICKEPEERFDNIDYRIVSDSILTRLRAKLSRNNKHAYLQVLKKLLRKDNSRFVIQVIDNSGLVLKLHKMLEQTGNRNRCYIQYFYHGFPLFFGDDETNPAYLAMDEVVFLTADSKAKHEALFAELPFRTSVLHNGIDTKKFYPVDHATQHRLKADFGQAGKSVFLWCSQDKPKKGLDKVLEFWPAIYQKYNDAVLLVVGAHREPVDGVVFFGKQPNDALPNFYQAADCYLFPTFYEEGFGMSLIEALHCGCYCIASAKGGVPEVMQYGKLGKLIENPDSGDAWTAAIEEFLKQKVAVPKIPENQYTADNWSDGMNRIISQAKLSFK